MATNSTDIADLQFPVVGIGASAGGLEAIKLFLKGIPNESGMAYVFVQHLNPNHESALTEILSRNANLPIIEVRDDVQLRPDHFYVIPSNKILTVVDGKLKLDPRNEKNKKVKLIDIFFSSLGVVYQSFAVGVILSGTLDDGTLGLKVIKAEGGITFAQDDTAAYEGMPHHAIMSGVADFILPPDKIVSTLLEITKPFHDNLNNKENAPILLEDEDAFRQIITILRLKKGVDFSHYKQTTVIRRIQRRMALNKYLLPVDYLKVLRESKIEQDALFNDMLISVTEFFRDPKSFEVICDTIIPALLKSKPIEEPIRIWVAGCATGEEAYSLAIGLEEFFRKVKTDKMEGRKIQIFATDLSESAIVKARSGIYSESDLRMVSPERLERYFTKIDGVYQVNKSIRELCVFAQHNLLKDPPLSKMDLASCRNLLIYLEPILQRRVMTILHYALNEKGILVLGKSETINSQAELFAPFHQKEKIYIKKGTAGRFTNVTSAVKEQTMRNNDKLAMLHQPPVVNAYKKAEEILLTHYTPAGVLVNDNLDIVQFRGETETWLTPPPGKPSFNLLKMAREGLSFELRNILHIAKTKNAVAKKENVAFGSNGKHQYVSVEAIPIVEAPEPHFLVLFKNAMPFHVSKDANTAAGNTGDLGKNALAKRVEQLEKELAQNREDMRAITEDQEATNEELQSANEELLSGSEELQAINEELETAKEELQSTNEELLTLNHELTDRFEQLSKSQKFTEGVFATIRDTLLVLDSEYKIIKGTSGFYKTFCLTPNETVGKLLFELLDHHWNIPALRRYLENITEENSSFYDFELTQTFPSIGTRNLIFNGRQLDRVDGNKMFLLAIEDVTDKKKGEENVITLTKANEGLEHSNLELEQFAGIASHDLQEPLRKIITFSNIIQDRNLNISEPAKPYLLKIAQAAERMHNVIRDLLIYSRMAEVEQIFVPTDLNEVIKNIIGDFELVIEEKRAELIIKELPIVPAIPLCMNQLFYNLINNALKFSKKDIPPRIEIESKTLEGKDFQHYGDVNNKIRYSEIVVKDNGIGFDQKYAEQIFKLFNRLNNREEYPGTGIGLALCRKIALQHDGKIYVNSREGIGTSFIILLPLTRFS